MGKFEKLSNPSIAVFINFLKVQPVDPSFL